MKTYTEEQLYIKEVENHKIYVPTPDIITINTADNRELLRITPEGDVIAPSLEAANEAGRVFVNSLRENIGFLKNKIDK